jgi:hypothetical protein
MSRESSVLPIDHVQPSGHIPQRLASARQAWRATASTSRGSASAGARAGRARRRGRPGWSERRAGARKGAPPSPGARHRPAREHRIECDRGAARPQRGASVGLRRAGREQLAELPTVEARDAAVVDADAHAIARALPGQLAQLRIAIAPGPTPRLLVVVQLGSARQVGSRREDSRLHRQAAVSTRAPARRPTRVRARAQRTRSVARETRCAGRLVDMTTWWAEIAPGRQSRAQVRRLLLEGAGGGQDQLRGRMWLRHRHDVRGALGFDGRRTDALGHEAQVAVPDRPVGAGDQVPRGDGGPDRWSGRLGQGRQSGRPLGCGHDIGLRLGQVGGRTPSGTRSA